ncbi:hypothetical protein VSS74_19060 [Conexibacter stalactiti]|uniref:DUF4142 domain-containing protein n=1 Tax=Conexibacter stalactiti TaxID=1940611 RepID=A0ABU4HT08_9ACTN|nr:hypothetical protein [Conexibacter stalactiti]MDW5596455.1 hypothetical protein [Conexibacter stalactiti]MEC5037097.1 hypothetical protein [Conexibacter stalactiti]
MPRTLLRTTLLAVTLLLALPLVARADDQSFARAAITQAVTLDRHETATSKALAKVDTRGLAAVPGARRAIKLVRRQVDRMRAAVTPEQTSTPEGETAKRKLLEILAAEKRAYGTLDSALVAYKRGDNATARTLLSRAKRSIASIRVQAGRLGSELQAMAA